MERNFEAFSGVSMPVGLPPMEEMKRAVFQRLTRKAMCSGFEGSQWVIVRFGVWILKVWDG